MPTYDYECPRGHLSTTHRAIDERDEPAWCRICGQRVTRKPSAPGFTVEGFNAKNGYSKGQQ